MLTFATSIFARLAPPPPSFQKREAEPALPLQVAEDMKTEGRVPVEKFIIHKSLTKDPKEYADAKALPHVQVALRMRAGGKSVRMLDTIPYIVCNDGSANPATQRAYHPDDLRKQDRLQIDVEYYLKNQVFVV